MSATKRVRNLNVSVAGMRRGRLTRHARARVRPFFSGLIALPDLPSSVVREDRIEYGFIGTLQLFIVSNRIETVASELGFPPFDIRNSPFEVSPARHFAFNATDLVNSARLSAGETKLSLVA